MNKLKTLIAVITGLVFALTTGYGQTISGKVMDSRYQTGIDSIRVFTVIGNNETYTDENGNFTLTSVAVQNKLPVRPEVFFNELTRAIEWQASEPALQVSLVNFKGRHVTGSKTGPADNQFRIPSRLEDGFYLARIKFASGSARIFFMKLNNMMQQVNSLAGTSLEHPATVPAKSGGHAEMLQFEKDGWVSKSQNLVPGTGHEVILTRQKIKTLIVDGFNNHNWAQTTVVASAILNTTEFYDITVSTSPAAMPTDPAYDSWNPNFADYDVIVMNVCNINMEGSVQWPERIQAELEEYLAGGGAMFNLHASVASFKNWDEYSKMIGLGWRDAGFGSAIEIIDDEVVEITGGNGTGHGAQIDALVTELNPHPITSGMPPVWMAHSTEVYQYARGLPENFDNINILSYANQAGKNWPFNLLISYGQGYAFSTYTGHLWSGEKYPDRMADIGLHTILIRATEWMARGEIIYPIPDNFPTESAFSLDTTLSYLNDSVY